MMKELKARAPVLSIAQALEERAERTWNGRFTRA